MSTLNAERPTPLKPLSHEELQDRRQPGAGNFGLVEDPIEALFEAAEAAHETPPVEERSWKTSRTEISYRHPLFGTISVGVKNSSLGEPQHQGPNSWARIFTPDRNPELLEITAAVKQHRGIKVMEFTADPVSESDDQSIAEITDTAFKPFPVKVAWQNGKPSTRVKHRDNFDIILLNPENGTFIQLEISVTTRNGYFWLLVQEQHCGQWVRTTQIKATELGLTSIAHGRYPLLVVPLYAENAYPTADYLKTFGEIGRQMAPLVIKWDALVPYSKSVVATWAPEPAELPEAMKLKGWKTAVPYHFNGVTGQGPALCEDGEMCYVHFSVIIGTDGAPVGSRGKLPILEPMKTIAIKYADGEKGRRATAVRVL